MENVKLNIGVNFDYKLGIELWKMRNKRRKLRHIGCYIIFSVLFHLILILPLFIEFEKNQLPKNDSIVYNKSLQVILINDDQIKYNTLSQKFNNQSPVELVGHNSQSIYSSYEKIISNKIYTILNKYQASLEGIEQMNIFITVDKNGKVTSASLRQNIKNSLLINKQIIDQLTSIQLPPPPLSKEGVYNIPIFIMNH